MNPVQPATPRVALLGRLARHAAQRPNAPAYRIPEGGSLSYGQLAGAVAGFSSVLRDELPRGSVVVLSCANRLENPAAFLGILAAGCTVFPISPESGEVELINAARESGAACVVGDERSVQLLRPILGCAIPVERALAERGAEPDAAASTGDLLLQSSGTTGLPKIVRRSGPSLDAEALAVVESVGFGPDDRVLMAVPLTHSYGLEHGLLAPVWAGSCVHLCRGLDPSIILPELTVGGITIFPGVPSMFEMIGGVAAPGIRAPMLRRAYSAGATLPRSVFERFSTRFGIPVTQLYGASEIGSVSFNAPADSDSSGFDPASVGRAMRDVSIRILGLDGQDDPLPPGEQGQVTIRAASMFIGYMNHPAPLIDGHFATGDLGHLDSQDRLFITGRIKLLIDVGGLKVNPLEVEAVLETHPAVEACVVVPVRQSETVFRLKAVITPREAGIVPSVAELRDLVRAHLAAYKVPRLFEFRDSLPRSRTGKILRHLVEAT